MSQPDPPGPSDAERRHFWLTWLWVLLLPPTLIWWYDSVTWVVIMSWWANFSSHWGSYDTARLARRMAEITRDPEDAAVARIAQKASDEHEQQLSEAAAPAPPVAGVTTVTAPVLVLPPPEKP